MIKVGRYNESYLKADINEEKEDELIKLPKGGWRKWNMGEGKDLWNEIQSNLVSFCQWNVTQGLGSAKSGSCV